MCRRLNKLVSGSRTDWYFKVSRSIRLAKASEICSARVVASSCLVHWYVSGSATRLRSAGERTLSRPPGIRRGPPSGTHIWQGAEATSIWSHKRLKLSGCTAWSRPLRKAQQLSGENGPCRPEAFPQPAATSSKLRDGFSINSAPSGKKCCKTCTMLAEVRFL